MCAFCLYPSEELSSIILWSLLYTVEFSHQDTIPNKNDTTYTYDVAESSEWQVVYFGPSSTQVSSAIYSVSLNRDVYLTSNQEVSSTRDKSYAVPTTFSHFPPLPPTVTMSESTTFTTSTKSYNSVYETLTTHTVFASSSIAVSATPTAAPTGRTPTTIDYKLIICVVVPLFTVIVFVIVVAMVLCIRRYRK